MSGHKMATVTISQEEYRRLYEMEKSLQYDVESDPNFLRENLNLADSLHLENFCDTLYHNYQDAIQNFDSSIHVIESDLNQQFHDLEKDQIIRLTELNASLQSSLRENQSLLSTTQSGFQQIERNLTGRINELENELNSQHNRIENLETEVENILNANDTILEYIHSVYPGLLVDQNLVAELAELVQDAANNLENGHLESALSLAQSTYRRTSSYRRRLDQLYLEWVFQYQKAMDELIKLSEILYHSQSVDALGFDGSLLETKIDTNQWSSGHFAECSQRYDELVDQLKNDQDTFTLDQLAGINEDVIPGLKNELSDCVTSARIAALSSQMRYQLANKILLGLIQQGFQPVEGFYQDDDFMHGYFARAKNIEGNVVEIRIEPSAELVGENEIHVISLDQKVRTQHELVQRAAEIRNAIDIQGLAISNFEEIHEPLPTVSERQNVKTRKAQSRRNQTD